MATRRSEPRWRVNQPCHLYCLCKPLAYRLPRIHCFMPALAVAIIFNRLSRQVRYNWIEVLRELSRAVSLYGETIDGFPVEDIAGLSSIEDP